MPIYNDQAWISCDHSCYLCFNLCIWGFVFSQKAAVTLNFLMLIKSVSEVSVSNCQFIFQ